MPVATTVFLDVFSSYLVFITSILWRLPLRLLMLGFHNISIGPVTASRVELNTVVSCTDQSEHSSLRGTVGHVREDVS